jgi:hypothetical protein
MYWRPRRDLNSDFDIESVESLPLDDGANETIMEEAEGFEPSVPFTVQPRSRRFQSATLTHFH